MVITYLFLLFFDTFRRWSAWDTFKSASGKKLCDLKKKTFVDDSGQVRKIKWGGKGHLTYAVIESLTVYFGGAICNFPGDMDGMFRAIWAVFHH